MRESTLIFKKLFLFCLLLLWFCSSNSLGQSYPLWGNLSKGSYTVGFKSLWELDFSRTYNIAYEDKTSYTSTKAPRPILINIWYPAKARPNAKSMLYKEYLAIESKNPQLVKFSQKLIEFNKNIVIKELLNKPEKDLSEKEKQLFETFLNTPTAAIKNAVPAQGKFPLIIYHSGAGSSIEDNSVLCEFLASNGYVVINSAYQHADGSSLSVDGDEGSTLDIRYLISYASRLPYVNWNKIGTMGHSRGAQAVIIHQTRNNSVVDALVSLDTTQDYQGLSMPLWNDMVKPVLKNIKNISVPSLVVAENYAIFQMWDLLEYAERYYFTTKHLEHNDFISQGLIKRALSQKTASREAADKSRENTSQKEFELARKDYEALSQYVLNFFNAYLKDDKRGKDYLLSKYKGAPFYESSPHVEYVPKKVKSPEKYDISSSIPPTPRQIRYILADNGIERTVDLLRKFWKKDSPLPLYGWHFSFSLIPELIDKGKNNEALAIYNLYGELDDKFKERFIRRLTSYGEIFQNPYFFKKVLVLDPGNAKAAEKLKELETKNGDSKPD